DGESGEGDSSLPGAGHAERARRGRRSRVRDRDRSLRVQRRMAREASRRQAPRLCAGRARRQAGLRPRWARLPALEHGRELRGDPVRALLILVLTLPLGAQEIYDLLLKNGHVIDPANRRNGRFDVAITGNKIARVGADLPASHARVVVDAGQYYVTPGLIDIYTHYDWVGPEGNLKPDAQALASGVTTAA